LKHTSIVKGGSLIGGKRFKGRRNSEIGPGKTKTSPAAANPASDCSVALNLTVVFAYKRSAFIASSLFSRSGSNPSHSLAG
jgi:hypothetical protein